MKVSKYKKSIDEKLKDRAFKLYQEGLSTRAVGAVVSRSHQWVAYVVREKEGVRKKLDKDLQRSKIKDS